MLAAFYLFMTIFYLFVSLLLLQSLISFKQGLAYLQYFRSSLASPLADFTPVVAIIAPCKGLDNGMERYLDSLFQLDYPNYQIIFVLEDQTDLAIPLITYYQAQYSHIPCQLLIAGCSQNRGQKVHNLLTAVANLKPEVAALAFIDSDIYVPRHWLRTLVAPLADRTIGATTGYRWFIPSSNLATLLRSVWNGTTATSLGNHRNNFAWGGSMAILTETFKQIEVEKFWQGTVSDDYGLTCAVQKANLYVKFMPQCLVPSLGETSFQELREFTTRQVIITRIYSPKLWRVLFISNMLFNLVFYLGLGIGIFQALHGQMLTLVLMGIIYLLGVGKGYLRFKSISLILTEHKPLLSRYRWAYYSLAPVVALLFFDNLIGSLQTNRITWRGITYQLDSANKTTILDR